MKIYLIAVIASMFLCVGFNYVFVVVPEQRDRQVMKDAAKAQAEAEEAERIARINAAFTGVLRAIREGK